MTRNAVSATGFPSTTDSVRQNAACTVLWSVARILLKARALPESSIMLLLIHQLFAAEPGTANFTNKGFTISDAAGKNTVNLGFTLQPRVTFTLDGDPDATHEDAVSDLGLR